MLAKPRIAVLLILTAALLSTCGVPKRVPVSAPPTHGGLNWVAVEQGGNPDKFLVIAKGNQAETDAVKALCSKEYICFGPDFVGEALIVERRKK